ncbi:spore germination lipoprotein GerD [Paenibacillus sp. GCM10012307]|uniref:Spore gernimation protein n=1 Tax=Paenibacillus roseus TaxID=2798579 RepID=A0A934J0J0_9BACL|nr:spore germination lipoprotein GerD [Paenibacillus roseus]MBJ6361079.1 spore gernimation protein [Paenibacillus roseus]
MSKKWPFLALSALMAFLLSSCGSEPSSGGQQFSYKDMKSMVIDILKTEDAQKALQESTIQSSGASGSQMGMLSVQDHEQIRMAVKEVLISPDYDKVIQTLMTDPRFAGEFAKSVNKQNKQIHKDLLKDPAYQKDLLTVMKNPEMERVILDVLQSTQYRKHVNAIMQESMQSPLVRLQMLDLLKKAVQEELKPKPDEKVKSGEDKSQGEEENQGNMSGSDGNT